MTIKSRWYSISSLRAFFKHELRHRQGDGAEEKQAMAKVNTELEGTRVNVHSGNALESDHLRVERDEDGKLVLREYREDVDIRREEAKLSSKQASAMEDM